MKKLMSLLLATIMIFSCCTLAVNGLYMETVTETDYVDSLVASDRVEIHAPVTYDSLNLSGLKGQDFIDALTADVADPKVVTHNVDAYPVLNGFGEIIKQPNITGSTPIVEAGKVVGYNYTVEEKDGEVVYYDLAYGEKATNLSRTVTTSKQYEILGVPVDFIYNTNSILLWNMVTAFPGVDFNDVDLSGTALNGINLEGVVDIGKSDITLIFGNINMYLLRVLKSLYSDFRFFTDENAVALINCIGKLFYPNFAELPSGLKLFSNLDYIGSTEKTDGTTVSFVGEEEFFSVVAERSGLGNLIQKNWVDYGQALVNFRPLINLIGVTDDMLLASEYFRGDRIAEEILRCAYTRIMGEGPVAFCLDLFEGLSKMYQVYYFDAIKALFTQKKDLIDEADLATLTGLLNLIFNDNQYSTVIGADGFMEFQFAPLPEKRLATCETKAEFYLIMLMYMNLNAHYLDNEAIIQSFCNEGYWLNKVVSDEVVVDEEGNESLSDRAKIKAIINGICSDKVELIFFDGIVTNLTMENISNKPDEFMGNIRESINRMIKKISDWFQMWIDIFTGKLEFGAGAFD